MAQRQHLFIRNGLWYWRRTYRAASLLRSSQFLSCEGEIALALRTREKSRAQAIGRQLSTLFEAWMDRFRMLGMLETLDSADFRALIGWALQDARDVYLTRVALPDAIPDAIRARQVNKLRAEAAVIEEAIKSGDFSMVQGLAADLLRRRSIRFEFDAPVFRSFVKEVAPSLVEARLAEIIRLDPHEGLGWAQLAPAAPAAALPLAIESTAAATLLPAPELSGPGRKIKECLDGFMADAARSEKFTDKTASQYRQTIKLLTEFLGNVPVRKVDRAQAARFKELVLRLPQKYGQSSRYTVSVVAGARLKLVLCGQCEDVFRTAGLRAHLLARALTARSSAGLSATFGSKASRSIQSSSSARRGCAGSALASSMSM
jgi:hypothetical protein